MNTAPFHKLRGTLAATPRSSWTATIASVVASILFVALLPLLYLFTDLMVHKGRIPTYSQLSQNQQAEFQERWATLGQNPEVAAILSEVRPSQVTDTQAGDFKWEWRWRAMVYDLLNNRIGGEAAETYLSLENNNFDGAQPTGESLGVLSLVVRDRDSWTLAPLSRFARWNHWTWNPGQRGLVNLNYLTGIFCLGFGLILIRSLLINLSAYTSTSASITAATRLRRSLFNHGNRLSSLSIRKDAQTEAGELVTEGVEAFRMGVHSYLTGLVRYPVLIVSIFIYLLLLQFWLTLSMCLLALAVWLVVGQIAAWYRRDARHAKRRAEARLSQMRESLMMTQLSKAYLMERYSQARFERLLSDLSRATWRRQRGDAISRPALMTIVSLATVVMFYVGGRVILGGSMTVAALVVLIVAGSTLVYTIERWMVARVRVARASEIAADILEFLERRADTGQAMDAEFLKPMETKLDFQGVSVREVGSGRMIVENLTMTFPAGKRIAIVTNDEQVANTIGYLTARFLDPTGGEIRIDGKNTRWVTNESIRSQVALVLEGMLTFSDTVAMNIGCGDSSFSLPHIIEAAKLAHAHQFIQQLPYGYETTIGDGGVTLSMGERYRIALARAVLRDPSIIVFQEPPEPLDADTLMLIDDTMVRIQKSRTLIFLARRPTTVENADMVYLLDHGKLVAFGKPSELADKHQLYRLLHTKQTEAALV